MGLLGDTTQPSTRAFDDIGAMRGRIYDGVRNAYSSSYPIENKIYRLELSDVDYDDDEPTGYERQKKAIIGGKTLHRPLSGTWNLVDKANEQVIDTRRGRVAQVPHMTERGTFIYNGSEYTLANQMRLKSGVYTRQKENGDLESHFNVESGSGPSFRVFMDPKTGVFHANVGQAKFPLYTLLKNMGVKDEQLRQAWGRDLLAVNVLQDNAKHLDKAYEKFMSRRAALAVGDREPGDVVNKAQELRERFAAMRLDPDVMESTLGQRYDTVSPDVMVAATKKLAGISRGEADTDDRDNIAYQRVLGPEDLMADRISRDAGQTMRKLLWSATFRKNLDPVINTDARTKQLQAVLLKSGLGMALEETNLIDVMDQLARVSRMGAGGIPSTSAIPDESRAVQPSYLCYDDYTLVLTECGWLPWRGVDEGVRLACRIGGKESFEVPTAVIHQFYDGEMIGLSSKLINYCVTPNHRMWSSTMRSPDVWRFETAEELFGVRRRFCVALTEISYGSPDSIFNLPIPPIGRCGKRGMTPLHDIAIDMSDWLEFLGWFLSEGYCYHREADDNGRGSCFRVTIAQSETANVDKCRVIEILLNKLPFRWRYSNKISAFVINSKHLTSYLKQFGRAYEKSIPRYAFKQGLDARKRLLTALLLGDGCQESRTCNRYVTTSNQLALDVHELATSLGMVARINSMDSPSHLANAAHRPRWRVSVSSAGKEVATSRDQGQFSRTLTDSGHYREHYRGMVHCAQVPGGLLYVMRDGRPMWSGNSFIDPIRTSESDKAGVDNRLAYKTLKGDDGQLYTSLLDKRGKERLVSSRDAARASISFPGERQRASEEGRMARAIVKGRMKLVPPDSIDFELGSHEDMMSTSAHLIPFLSAIKGQRMLMTTRMLNQSLALQNPEAPLVQTRRINPDDPDDSFEKYVGGKLGTIHSETAGSVVRVDKNNITVRNTDGSTKRHELYQNFPLNRKSFTHSTPVVRAGDIVKPGQLLAKSNFTDDTGTAALGKNLRVGYLPYKGMTFEDAIVISSGAAAKLTSEHMYQHDVDIAPGERIDKRGFLAKFPAAYKRQVVENFDDNGVIKVGTRVRKDDPLVLSLTKRPNKGQGVMHRNARSQWSNTTRTWQHDAGGVVTDVHRGPRTVNVVVKSYHPMEVGDKLTNRFASKGVIGQIVPDDKMPRDANGDPLEVMIHPFGVISRCYDDKTEFLTQRGWVLGSEVLSDDVICAFDPATGAMEFSEQQAPMHSADYRGDLITFVNDFVDFAVTPGHTMLSRPDYARGQYSVTRIDSIERRRRWVPAIGEAIELEGDATFTVPECEYERDTRKPENRKPMIFDSADWAEFLGWYLAEGHTIAVQERCEHKVFIAQCERANPDKCAQINYLLTRMGLKFFYKRSTTQFVMNSKQLALHMRTLGMRCYNKIIPDWLFDQSVTVRQKFIDAVWLGDGYCAVNKAGSKHSSLTLTSEGMINQVSALLAMQGVANRVYPACVSPGDRPMWRCGIYFRKKERLLREGWSRVSYNGRVYCPTVSTGFVLARRNGKAIVAGNTNPALMLEAALGKVAAKTGKPYKIDGTSDEDFVEFVQRELQRHGMSDTEDLTDPERQAKIKKVFVGNQFFMKLHHRAEDKLGVRGEDASYTADMLPGKTKGASSKRIGGLETTSLLSAGATEVLRDAKLIRGQKNDDFWRAFKLGYPPPTPEVPFVYRKFMDDLKAAGVNVQKEGNYVNIMALTDKDIDKMSRGPITQSETLDFDTMDPVKGGLFDMSKTGGHQGCFHASVQIWTEFGMLPIGKIVNERLQVRVWSYDFAKKEFVLKPVTNWFKNRSSEKIGRAIFDVPGRLSGRIDRFSPTTLWGTPQHQVLDADGIKHDLASCDQLLGVTEMLSYVQEQILYGSLLGDGHVTPYGYFSEVHCAAQRGYLDMKHRIFGALSREITCSVDRSGGSVREKARFRTKAHAVFHEARELCYPSGKKKVTRVWLDRLGELGLAIWFMDDGSARRGTGKNTAVVQLHTEGFSRADVELLRDWLYERWGLATAVSRKHQKYGNRDCGWVIRLSAERAEALLDIVAPYVPKCLHYKLLSRPATSYCSCGQEICAVRRVCNRCHLEAARACGTAKLAKSTRRLFGRTGGVRVLLARGEYPPDSLEAVRVWETRLATAGSRVPALLIDSDLRLGLKHVESTYLTNTGMRYESVVSVYDITVADIHNYFANGILVSNSGWSHINLHEPMPNPVMEEPIRRLLGLTEKAFRSVLSGERELNGQTGPNAVSYALKVINVEKQLEAQKQIIRSGAKSKRDLAVKRLRTLTMFKKTGIKPSELMLSKVPVMPPQYRPVARLGSKVTIVSDPNQLYEQLMMANDNLKGLAEELGGEGLGAERLTLYDTFKSLTGLADPIQPELQERGVRGILGHALGIKASPKFSDFQRKVIGTTTDIVGRGVITPNPSLNMDQVGLPEEKAWTLYRPFIIRRLVRGGVPATIAATMAANEDPRARAAMMKEMESRPVIINRAPTLHRYGIMAAYPILVKGKTLQVSPLTTSGFGADFDGDSCSLDTRLALRVKGAVVTLTGEEFLEDVLQAKSAREARVWTFDSGDVQTLNEVGQWVDVASFSLHRFSGKMFCVELRDGTQLKVTDDHSLMVEGLEVRPEDLRSGVLLDHCCFPVEEASGFCYESAFKRGYIDGYYLGDGCADGRIVGLASASAEHRDLLLGYLMDAYGLSAHNSRSSLFVGSVDLSCKLLKRFGRYCDKKFIGPMALNSEPEYLWGLVAGYIDSDGSVENTASGSYLCRITSVNESLLRDLSFVLWMLGVPHAMRRRNRSSKRPAWVVSIGRDGITMLVDNVEHGSVKFKKLNRAALAYKSRKTEKRAFLHKANAVVSVKPIPSEPWVFDLSAGGVFCVENGVIVHNTMNFHVPVSDEARDQAVSKMLPSRNLTNVREFDVHYVPSQEYLHGLFRATIRKSRREPRVFKTAMDARRAYRRGELGVDDPVKIMES